MKKLFYIAFFIFIFSFPTWKGWGWVFSQTNVYHPFPDSNAVWRVDYGNNQCSSNPVSIYQNQIEGDTTIGSYSYKKIMRSGIFYPCSIYSSGYSGGLRQDTAAKKVYCTIPDYQGDLLYFDFSLNVGDTLPPNFFSLTSNWPYDTTFSDTFFIVSIDSVPTNNGYIRAFLTGDGFSYIRVIEGIGHENGLFETWWPGPGAGSCLICFKQDSFLYEPNQCWDNYGCTIVNSIIEKKTPNDLIKIYPNPVTGISAVESFSGQTMVLEIYNSLGVKVREEKIKNKGKVFINNKEFSPGLFFYKTSALNGACQKGILVIL